MNHSEPKSDCVTTSILPRQEAHGRGPHARRCIRYIESFPRSSESRSHRWTLPFTQNTGHSSTFCCVPLWSPRTPQFVLEMTSATNSAIHDLTGVDQSCSSRSGVFLLWSEGQEPLGRPLRHLRLQMVPGVEKSRGEWSTGLFAASPSLPIHLPPPSNLFG